MYILCCFSSTRRLTNTTATLFKNSTFPRLQSLLYCKSLDNKPKINIEVNKGTCTRILNYLMDSLFNVAAISSHSILLEIKCLRTSHYKIFFPQNCVKP